MIKRLKNNKLKWKKTWRRQKSDKKTTNHKKIISKKKKKLEPKNMA
jgi:hypothetical protein